MAEAWMNQMGRLRIFDDIVAERARQDEKFPNELVLPYVLDPPGARETYRKIAQGSCDRAQREGRLHHDEIIEEEAAELLDARTREEKRREAVQLAACCVKLIEQIDREEEARRG
jgi:hypothetical protein